MKRRIHPSRRRLQRWLDDGNAPIDAHVETCNRCADTLESLARPNPPLDAALRTALEVPDGLEVAIQNGLNMRLQQRGDLELLGSLLAVPAATLRLLTGSPAGDDSQSSGPSTDAGALDT